MQQTSHYQLNQWDAEDRIQRTDFNSDNAKVDAVLAEQAADLSAQAVKLAKCGNCQSYTTSYTGNGSYDASSPNSITFTTINITLNCSHNTLARVRNINNSSVEFTHRN